MITGCPANMGKYLVIWTLTCWPTWQPRGAHVVHIQWWKHMCVESCICMLRFMSVSCCMLRGVVACVKCCLLHVIMCTSLKHSCKLAGCMVSWYVCLMLYLLCYIDLFGQDMIQILKDVIPTYLLSHDVHIVTAVADHTCVCFAQAWQLYIVLLCLRLGSPATQLLSSPAPQCSSRLNWRWWRWKLSLLLVFHWCFWHEKETAAWGGPRGWGSPPVHNGFHFAAASRSIRIAYWLYCRWTWPCLPRSKVRAWGHDTLCATRRLLENWAA